MITNIDIYNFKSLANISLQFSNLNVITGINGMGKSTLIQSLLLLRQAYVPNGVGRGVPLKGPLTGNLGVFNDVLYRNAQVDKIGFTLELEGHKCVWEFGKSEIEDLLQGSSPQDSFDHSPLFSDDGFQYIGAGRITPLSSFSKSGEALKFKQFGSSGEYAIQYLFERGTDVMALISDAVHSDNGKLLPLISQVDYWLRQITPSVRLDIKPKSGTEYELRYEFLTAKGFASYLATNSPFGLTFSLPIITAILASKSGDLLILENPESDLHPQAQSIIGQLIARGAAAGVQIILETHSDHIINGICLAIHNKQLQNDKAKFYYFHKFKMDMESKAYEIPVSSNGRIDDRKLREAGVDGFFDQARKDMENILFGS